MKHWIYLILFLFASVGCGKRLAENSLELTQTEISCTCKGGDFKIGITGRQDWTTDNCADWVDITRGKDSALFRIAPNGGGFRQHNIGFKLNGTTVAEITITQEQSDIFSISTENISIGHHGGDVHVDIICFKEWTASSEAEWIRLSSEGGSGPQSITLKVSASDERNARKSSVRFCCEEKYLTLTIVQDEKPFIDLEKNLVEFDGDGGQTHVLYMSNTEISICCDHDWIRIISTESSIKKVSFEVNRNLGSSREGVIRLTSADDEEIYETITVRQGPKIDHPKLSIAEGNHLDLSSRDILTLHPVFEDMTDLSLAWKSDNPDIASVDAKGIVTIHTGGSCTITASNSFHNVTASISLRIRLLAQDMTVMFGVQKMNESPIAVRFAGEKISVKVIMDPVDAYSDDITYYSTDNSVASIIGNTIHCLKPGKAEIYIESLYQSLRQKYTVIVTE